uniref:Uncharacterized protein n=1 Tax=Zea mays TaxID=4577 RepID=A0A804NPR1_MAIZE
MPSVSNAQTSIADVALLRSNQLPFLLLCPADAPPSIFLSAATLPWLCPYFLSELAPAPTSDVSSPSRPAPPSPWFPPCSDQVCQVRPFCSPCPPHASTRAPLPSLLLSIDAQADAELPAPPDGVVKHLELKSPCLSKEVIKGVRSCDARQVSEFLDSKSETDVDVDYNSLYSKHYFLQGEKTGRDENEVLKAIDYVHELSMSDEGVHWAVQNGLHLSRSTVVYFKHNDVASLASTLEKLTRGNKRAEKIRRYIVVESIYKIIPVFWVGLVNPDLAINKYMVLHQDRNDLTVRQCILEHVPDDEDQRQALPGLGRSRRWLESLQKKDQPKASDNLKLSSMCKTAVGRPRPDFWRCFPDGKQLYDQVTGDVICHGEKTS